MPELRLGVQGAIRRRIFFFVELTAGAANLLRDVYRLARGLHWPEHDILDLTLRRRAAYLLLMEEEADSALLAGLTEDVMP
jgi:hypothetical protein